MPDWITAIINLIVSKTQIVTHKCRHQNSDQKNKVIKITYCFLIYVQYSISQKDNIFGASHVMQCL